jgi:SH3 domain protein
VKRLLALCLALGAPAGHAATAYVSDELLLGVYAEQDQQGERLATLHSGASVETLSSSGEFTQVRLSDGTTGWVKSAYLTTREPAAARVKQLEDELSRSRATAPELAEAAARSEVERLKGELAAKQVELEAARGAKVDSTPAAQNFAGARHAAAELAAPLWVCAAAAFLALALGFYWGYATLARRVRRKFGGLKVY